MHVRCRRAAPGRGGALRRDGVHGAAPHAGDRRSHGARREPAGRDADGAVAGLLARRRRRRHRPLAGLVRRRSRCSELLANVSPVEPFVYITTAVTLLASGVVREPGARASRLVGRSADGAAQGLSVPRAAKAKGKTQNSERKTNSKIKTKKWATASRLRPFAFAVLSFCVLPSAGARYLPERRSSDGAAMASSMSMSSTVSPARPTIDSVTSRIGFLKTYTFALRSFSSPQMM